MTQDEKIDKILEHMVELREAQAAIDATRPLYIARIADLESRLDPLEKHDAMMVGALKLLGVLSLLTTLGAACRKFFTT